MTDIIKTDRFLSGIFEKLANDPSWPWTSKDQRIFRQYKRGDPVPPIIGTFLFAGQASFVAESPLNMARLALMVVEKETALAIAKVPPLRRDASGYGYSIEESRPLIIQDLGISPDHYANVKDRVKKADTEGK